MLQILLEQQNNGRNLNFYKHKIVDTRIHTLEGSLMRGEEDYAESIKKIACKYAYRGDMILENAHI